MCTRRCWPATKSVLQECVNERNKYGSSRTLDDSHITIPTNYHDLGLLFLGFLAPRERENLHISVRFYISIG